MSIHKKKGNILKRNFKTTAQTDITDSLALVCKNNKSITL